MIGILSCALVWVAATPRARQGPQKTNGLSRSRSPRSSFETSLREAGRWRGMAVQQVADGLEGLAEWDPQAGDVVDRTARRAWEAQMAQDRGGYLHRAVIEARRAAMLARTPGEKYRVTARMALLECNLGHHQAELQMARRLVEMQPRNELSLLWFRRAARCTEQRSLENWADGRLRRIRTMAWREEGARPPFDPGNSPSRG